MSTTVAPASASAAPDQLLPLVTIFTTTEHELLTRAVEASFEGRQPKLWKGLVRLLEPADRVLQARAYRAGYTRFRVLNAIIRGAAQLGTPPQTWSAEDWGTVRRTHGGRYGFAFIIVAAQGYGVMPGRDYNLPLNTPRLALARELFGQEAVDREFG